MDMWLNNIPSTTIELDSHNIFSTDRTTVDSGKIKKVRKKFVHLC